MKNKLEILYEDNHIIVVVKPFNILSQSDDTKDLDMLSIVKNYIKETYQKPGNVYIGLVHRLDRPTGGIMMFAKTSKAASRLSKQIQEKQMIKKYLAVIKGNLEKKEGKLTNYVMKTNNNDSIITTKEKGKEAILSYKVIKEQKDTSLIEVILHTGRHHQIRVQFAHIGHALYGDQRYGLQDKKQLALYAYQLSFHHPVTKEQLGFTHIPNKIGIWKELI